MAFNTQQIIAGIKSKKATTSSAAPTTPVAKTTSTTTATNPVVTAAPNKFATTTPAKTTPTAPQKSQKQIDEETRQQNIIKEYEALDPSKRGERIMNEIRFLKDKIQPNNSNKKWIEQQLKTYYSMLNPEFVSKIENGDSSDLQQAISFYFGDEIKQMIPFDYTKILSNGGNKAQTTPATTASTALDDTTASALSQGQQVYDNVFNYYMDTANSFGKTTPEEDAMIEQQAKTAAEQATKAIDDRMKRVIGEKDTQMYKLGVNRDMAQKALEDNMFQQFLRTRQSMGNRGLSTSGLMDDATTRLGIARQDELAKILSNYNENAFNVQSKYTDAITSAEQERSNNTSEMLAKSMRDKFIEAKDKTTKTRLESVDNILQGLSQYGFINPTSALRESTKIQVAELKNSLEYAKLSAKMQMAAEQFVLKYNLQKAQIFGYDENGNPTLDARKLANSVFEKAQSRGLQQARIEQGWARIGIQEGNLKLRMEQLDNLNAQRLAQQNNGDLNRFVNNLSSDNRNLSTQVITLENILVKEPDSDRKKAYQTELNKLKERIEINYALIDDALGSDNRSSMVDSVIQQKQTP